MTGPNFLPLDPDDTHGCHLCQRAVFDIDKGYLCPHLGIEISRINYVSPNDCEYFLSQWNNDLYKYAGKYLNPCLNKINQRIEQNKEPRLSNDKQGI